MYRVAKTTDQLMWEFQSHFRSSAQAAAGELFDVLDPRLRPHISLLGVAINDGSVIIDCGDRTLASESFSMSAAALAENEWTREQWNLEHGRGLHKLLSRLNAHDLKTPGHQLRNVLIENLRSNDPEQGVISFCGYPVHIEGYVVTLLLQFDRATFLGYCGDEDPELEVDCLTHSLLGPVVLEYLNAASLVLTEPDPGAKLPLFSREPAEMIRTAANTLTYKLTYLTRQWGYPVSLFEACNAISALKYEGEPAIGTMIVAEADHPEVDVVVELQTRVPLTDHRGTRKLLQMATAHLSLLSDAGYIYGLGRCRSTGSLPEGMIRIDFTGHYAWEINYAGRSLMRVVYGQPLLPGKPINATIFRESVRRIFRGITETEVDTLWGIALEASHQERGTLIVITTGARFEAQRLKNQCIQTKPMVPTPDVIRTITAIDGAVMLAPDGTCFAIGVILDGLTSSSGNPMRGSRFNSALRYVETSRRQFGYSCYAVIVSEDGMVDLVPEPAALDAADAAQEMAERLAEINDSHRFPHLELSSPQKENPEREVEPHDAGNEVEDTVRRDIGRDNRPDDELPIPSDVPTERLEDLAEDLVSNVEHSHAATPLSLSNQERKALVEWIEANQANLTPAIITELSNRIRIYSDENRDMSKGLELNGEPQPVSELSDATRQEDPYENDRAEIDHAERTLPENDTRSTNPTITTTDPSERNHLN